MNADGVKTESSRPPSLRPRSQLLTVPTDPVLSVNTAKKEEQNVVFVHSPLVDCIDLESRQGRFGWHAMAQTYIPYLVRKDQKYCSVRMFEKTIESFITLLNPRIYFDCSNIPSWYATHAEVVLLTEINSFHCNFQFGRENFKKNDVLVLLEDALEFFKFLAICFGKLFGTKSSSECGIILPNNNSPFPYVVVDNKQLVPLFFYEGIDLSTLNTTTTITGWPLAYLKFCFRVLRIQEEFFKQEECIVATLDEVKEFFKPGTVLKEFWPNCKLDQDLFNKTVCSTRSRNRNLVWYRPPTTPQLL